MVKVGLLRVLLAGIAVASTLGIMFTGGVTADAPPASMYVPALRVGDSVEYHENGTGPNLPMTAFRIEHLGRRFYNVTGTATMLDETGAPHETVVIDRDRHKVRIKENGSLTPTVNHDSRYFEPSSRSLVQAVGESEEFQPISVANARVDTAITRYGPSFYGGNFPAWDDYRVMVALQGRLLTEGQDLSAWFGPEMQSNLKRIHPTANFSYSLKVGAGGTWGHEPAIAVESRQVYSYPVRPGVSDGGTYWQNDTWWFVASIPFPVRMQMDEYAEEVAGDDGSFGRWRYRVVEDLVSFKRGAQIINWGPELRPLPVGASPPLEWGSRRHPEMGRVSHFAFSLDDAVRAAENDHTKPRFELWKAQNPGWQVVGFYTSPGQVGLPGIGGVQSRALAQTGWYLILSAPFGERIVRLEVRQAGGAEALGTCTCDVVQAGDGPADPPGTRVPPGRRFNPAWLPDRFVTLETAHKFWAALPNAGRFGSPNEASWGYTISMALGRANLAPSLAQVRYGSWDFDGPSPLSATADRAYVIVNASTGKVHYGVGTDAETIPPALTTPLDDPANPLAVPSEPHAENAFRPLVLGTAALSLTALLLSLLFPWAKNLFVGLYSKLRREEVLDHTLRDQLVTLIERNPGISQPLMQAHTQAGWSTLTYHLSTLSSKSVVTSVRDGRHRRYFRVGALDHGLLAGQAKLANAGSRRVFDMIRAQPGIDRATLTRLLGLAKSSVSWHLERLKASGLVRTEPRGKRIAYFASQHVQGIAGGHASVPSATPVAAQ